MQLSEITRKLKDLEEQLLQSKMETETLTKQCADTQEQMTQKSQDMDRLCKREAELTVRMRSSSHLILFAPYVISRNLIQHYTSVISAENLEVVAEQSSR